MSKSFPEKLDTFVGDVEETSKPSVVNNIGVYLAAFSSMMFSFAIGMTYTYPAQATEDMKKPGSRFHNITADEITWIGSLALLGGIPANLIAGYATHKFGRKAVMMLSSWLFVLSWLMIAYAQTIAFLCIGRIVAGFCTSFYVIAVQAYVSEISPQENRGLLSSGFPIAIGLGIVTVDGLGIVLRWSWLAISVAAICTFSTCMMFFMPESPVWLVRESRIPEAVKGIKFLKGRRIDSKKEIQAIIDGFSLQQDLGKLNYKDFLKPVLYKPLLISILLMFFHHATGIGPILVYTANIFHNAGSSVPPAIATVIIAVVQLTANFLSGITVDKFGRRILYMSSAIGTCIALLTLGTYSYLIKLHPDPHHLLGYIPLMSLIAFTFVSNLGLGCLHFVMIPEMVSIRYRSTVLSIVFLFAYFFAFLILKIFDALRSALGDYGLYYTYASITFIDILFAYFFLPETKNRPIEEITKDFSKS